MNRRALLGFTLSILLLIGLGCVSYLSILEFRRSAQKVSDSHQVQNALESLMADLASAESEARGYVIMGQEGYLSLYRSTVENTRENLKRLRSVKSDVASVETIESVAALVEQRLERLRLTIEARQTEGLDGVVGIAGAGKQLMDKIRKSAQDLQDSEESFLRNAGERLQEVSLRTTWIIAITGVLAVAFHLASTVALSRSMLQRHRLEKALLEASEREQRRIGQELHDGICQQLTGISLMVRSLHNEQNAALQGALKPIVDLLNGCIKETRVIIHGLHPVTDEPGGLHLGLRELALSTERDSTIPCHADLSLPSIRLDAETASNIYRIAQESIRNALQHSRCTHIQIQLCEAGHRLELNVQDDGIGFTGAGRVGGFGLAIMKHRAASIGGTLDITSHRGSGTRVRLSLPLQK
jgi:signal transduction histidine kinase